MNKISKKIVSLVTMAAFALTLVPAAAFAADATTATVKADAPNQISVDVKADDTAYNWYGIKVIAKDANGKALQDNSAVTVSGPSGNGTTYSNEHTGVVALASDSGVTPYTYSPTYNFNNVPVGDYSVEIQEQTSQNGDFKTVATESVTVTDPADPADSQLLVIDETTASKSVTINQGESATIEFNVKAGNDNSDWALNNASSQAVYVWAEKDGVIVNDVTFAGVDGVNANNKNGNTAVWKVGNASYEVFDGQQLTATFSAAGEYKIYAAVANSATVKAGTLEKDVFSGITYTKITPVTVKVEAPEVVTNSVSFGVASSKDNVHWYYKLNDNVTPSDTKMYTVNGTAWESYNTNPAENTTLTLSCDDNGDGITLQSTEAQTDEKGNFSVKFTLSETAKYAINVINEEGKVIGTLVIDQDDVNAASIAKISDGGTMLAGNDATYSSQVYGNGTAYFSDGVKLSITDVYGVETEGSLVLKSEYAASTDKADAVKHAENLRIVDKPKATDTTAASTLSSEDLALAWDPNAGVYTLAYVGDNAAKDLVPGEYSVRIALNQGGNEAVTVNFTLAKFGTAESIDFNITAAPGTPESYNDDAIKAIDDKVALGQYVMVKPVYVDENGIRVNIPAKNYSAAVTGKAVANSNTKSGNFWFTTRDNSVANESLIGSEVTVQVMDKNLGYQTKTLTIVSAYLNETLAFDSEQGAVDKNNLVNVTVVDENGDLVKVNGTLSAYVESQSNEDATVDVDVNKSVKNGAGKLYVKSDAEGTADIVVAVKAANGEMYAATLNYTFGDEDANAGSYVAMTIGSSEYFVNGKFVTGDAAPYVDSAWRTMVPFRVLGETFGATVNWDEDAQTVTYTLGDTEIVMTIGSDTYTVNGDEKTMDTAPVIQNSRTMVPVRFVAEALGYTVTALENGETGLTGSVVFQK